MCTVKRECALVVHFKRKGRFSKPAVSVAFAAIGHLLVFHKLTFMVISMAVGAFTVGHRCCQVTFVTRGACHCSMPSRKRIAGFAVVKSADPFNLPERLFGMALGTLLSKLVVVGVSMTIGAVLKSDSCKLLKAFSVAGTLLMTINTLNVIVFSFQLEAGFVVIKTAGRLKLHIVVAVSAIL